jgi:hypothetical protein
MANLEQIESLALECPMETEADIDKVIDLANAETCGEKNTYGFTNPLFCMMFAVPALRLKREYKLS